MSSFLKGIFWSTQSERDELKAKVRSALIPKERFVSDGFFTAETDCAWQCYQTSAGLGILMSCYPSEFTDADKVLFSICMDRLSEVAQLKNGFSRGEEALEGVIDVEA